MATIGRLAVKIDADTGGLKTGLKEATSSTEQASKEIIGHVKNIAGALGAYMSAAAFAGFIKGVADAGDQMAKLSQRSGVAVQQLSALNYAASLNDASFSDLEQALKGLSNKMLEAQTGSGEAGNVFAALGIKVEDASGKLRNADDVMLDIADAFQGMEDGAGKAALAARLMEESGVKLIPMLNNGRDGLEAMRQEAERLGVVMDDKLAQASVQLNDNMTRMNALFNGVGVTVGSALVPTLNQMTSELLGALNGTNNMTGSADALRKMLVALNNVGVGAITTFKLLGTALGGTAAAIGAALSGEFSQARNILSMMKEDLSNIAINAAQSMERVSNAQAVAGAAPAVSTGGKRAAPRITPISAPAASKTPEAKKQESKKIDDEDMKFIESLNKRLEALKEYNKTEEQLIIEKQAAQAETLRLSRENGLITEQQYMLMEQDMSMKHMDELARIRGDGMKALENITEQSWQSQAQTIAEKMGEMTAAAASGSKAMFNINKVAAIANALLKARESVTNAYAFGSKIGGPPLGAAMAGVAAAATAAQISAIKSQQFGGGGGVSAGGGGADVAPTQSAAAGANMGQTITIQGMSSGDIFSGDAVRTLIDRLIDAQRNGARIVLA